MTSDDELLRLAIEEAGSQQMANGVHALVFESAEEFASCFHYVNRNTNEYTSMQGMADCMRMVHQELMESDIIPVGTAPMFIREAVLRKVDVLEVTVRNQAALIKWWMERAETAERHATIAETKAAHWKSNHADQVQRARILLERTDMPLERVNAYKRISDVEADYKRFQACRHAAREMPEDGGEEALVIAIDKYRAEHGC